MPRTRSEIGKSAIESGKNFEQLVAMSWGLVPNLWRCRLRDSLFQDSPADEVVLTVTYRILCEVKETTADTVGLNIIKAEQLENLLIFETIHKDNVGILLINFNTKKGAQYYCIRAKELVRTMRKLHKQNIPLHMFEQGLLKVYQLECLSSGFLDLSDIDNIVEYLGD
jgi:hypothetical protein